MKQIFSAIIFIIAVIIASPATFISCTDVTGNGVDSVYYSGSKLAQDSSYRNPVWEPDLELGAVFAGPSN